MIAFTAANAKLWSRLGSRGVFGGIAAPELVQMDERYLFLAADVASSAGLGRLMAQFPEKVLNTGIAEQNMIGIAAGLAKEGFVPFAMSFAPFATWRCADQIRLCLGYMGLNVKVVGLASGLAMAMNGPSHYGLEDIAALRAIPGLTILSPADCTETVKATLAAAQHHGPVYLRLTGELGNPPVYTEDYTFEIGKAVTLREGKDIAIIATGTMVHTALEIATLLESKGIEAGVINMHTLKPLDRGAVENACKAKLLVTLEEHNQIGGLGSAVAETLAPFSSRPPLLIFGIPDVYPHAGTYPYLLEQCGLTPPQITESIVQRLPQIQ